MKKFHSFKEIKRLADYVENFGSIPSNFYEEVVTLLNDVVEFEPLWAVEPLTMEQKLFLLMGKVHTPSPSKGYPLACSFVYECREYVAYGTTILEVINAAWSKLNEIN